MHDALPMDVLLAVRAAMEKFPEVSRVYLFGSRAKGTHSEASDFDLALMGANISYDTVIQFRAYLNEETFLPWFFDVVHYETAEAAIRSHIDRVGKIIAQR